MHRSSTLFMSVATAAALLLAACGSDAEVDASKGTVAGAETTTTVTEEVTSTSAEPTTTAAPETTVEETTTTVAAPVVQGPADGVAYTNPEGEYTLLISPSWVDGSGDVPGEFQLWFTAAEANGFSENVNILTETVPSSTPLDAVLDASITQIEAQFESFALIRSEVVAGLNHPELGLLEYTAVQSGLEGRFVQVFGIWNDTLVVFTGSTDARLGTDGVDRLVPYALTLAPAG